jgi:CrcB protein
MVQPVYFVGAGGAAGAILRYAVGQWINVDRFPAGTVVVNALGSFLLGLAAFGGLRGSLSLFFAVGFCGSLTTYSSFSVDAVDLWDRDSRRAVLYVAVMSLVCFVSMGLAAGLVRLV